LNKAKEFMQTDEYSKYSLIKDDKVLVTAIALKDSDVSSATELEIAMETIRRKVLCLKSKIIIQH